MGIERNGITEESLPPPEEVEVAEEQLPPPDEVEPGEEIPEGTTLADVIEERRRAAGQPLNAPVTLEELRGAETERARRRRSRS